VFKVYQYIAANLIYKITEFFKFFQPPKRAMQAYCSPAVNPIAFSCFCLLKQLQSLFSAFATNRKAVNLHTYAIIEEF